MKWWLVGLFVLLRVLAGDAAAATMSTQITSTSFGPAHVGSANVSQTITISNDAQAVGTLTWTASSDLADYVLSATSGSLAPGQSVEVDVTLTPTARGARNATITISGNDASNPSDTFSVTGTGTSGNLVVTWTGSPGALAFGAVATTSGTSQRAITISNPSPGNETLTFSVDVTTGGSDYVETDPVDVTLAVGESVNVTITFDPSDVGTRTGLLTVTSDDALTSPVVVALTGTGDGAKLTPTPASIDAGTVLVGTFAEQTLTIQNTGTQAGSVTSITSGNATFTATVVGAALPRNLAPGASLEVTVRFTPVTGAVITTELTVMTTGTPATLMIPLTGDGLYEDVEVTIASEPDPMIDLGNRRVGVLVTRTVTVTNTGETAATLALPVATGAGCVIQPVTPATLPAVLDPGEAASFEIRVTPASVGAGSCTVTVETDLPTTDTIELTWVGVAPEVTLTLPAAGTLDFGVVDVDASPEIRTVVLANEGTAPLAVGPCTLAGSARFSMVSSCVDLFIEPGTSATLMVRFDPTLEASESATLTIGVDALSTSTVTVALSGVGADQRIDLSALSVSFPDTLVGSDDPPIAYIDVFNPVNPTTGTAQTLQIAMATTDSDVFTLANQGPFTVQAGAMIRLAITFHPDRAGAHEGTLTIVSDASANPMAAITLSGRGVQPVVAQDGCCGAGKPATAPLALLVLLVICRRRARR